MEKKTMIITIDGPAASGKSTVSREIAKQLGWKWVSTGAFYRGLAYVAQAKKVDLKDENQLVALANSNVWSVSLDPDMTRVFLDGKDVTQEIHAESVGTIASQISQLPKVRETLLPLQRNCAKGKGLVAEGRDCGSVVFPSADLKIYLTANSESRAQRRAQEKGEDVKNILEVQKVRDSRDLQRTVAPLQVPYGAQVVDTSTMDLNEVVSRVAEIVKSGLPDIV